MGRDCLDLRTGAEGSQAVAKNNRIRFWYQVPTKKIDNQIVKTVVFFEIQCFIRELWIFVAVLCFCFEVVVNFVVNRAAEELPSPFVMVVMATVKSCSS